MTFDPLPYMKIQHRHLGRGWETGDCLNLVRLFYERELGIELPDAIYSETWASEGQHFMELVPPTWGFVETDRPLQFGDVLTFRYRGLVYHCGVAIDPYYFIHTHTQGTSVECASVSRWARRCQAVWRHQSRIR
jgi:cell wall-associated NlpC family hydrolase